MSQSASALKKHIKVVAEPATDTGNVRSVNEDRFWVAPDSFDPKAIETKGQLFVVADGMGGYHAGDVAADIVARTMGESYYDSADSGGGANGDVSAALRKAVQQAQAKVGEEQQRNTDHAQMGSTVVAAVVKGNEVYVANVGDSRCYRLRNGQLKQLSKDHSWVAEQVAAGVLKPTETKGHPLRSALTRAIGQPQASPEPDIQRFDWQPHDRLLLCSDGLWDMLPDDKILPLLQKPKAQDSASALVKAANAAGGVDNITVVVVGDLPKPPLITRLLAPDALKKTLAGVVSLIALLSIGLLLALGGVFSDEPPVVEPTPEPLPVPTATVRRAASTPPTAAPVAAAKTETSAQTQSPTKAPATAKAPQPTPTLLGAKPATIRAGVATTTSAAAAEPAAAAIGPTTAFCAQLSGSGCASNTDSFAPATPNVYAAWSVPQLQDGVRFRVLWFRDGRSTGQPDFCTVQSGQCVDGSPDVTPNYGVFRLASIPGNKRGTYSFKMIIDGQVEPVLQGQFSVK